MGAVATSSARVRTPKVGKPLVQVSERVTSIADLLGVDFEETDSRASKPLRPLRWLDVLDQLTRIEARVEELQVDVEQVSAAEDGADSSAALTATFPANQATTATVGTAGWPLVMPLPAARGRFAAWSLPWSRAKPMLTEWAKAESASAQEVQHLRQLVDGDDLEMGRMAIWAVAASDSTLVPHLGEHLRPQALAFIRNQHADGPLHDPTLQHALPEHLVVVHHVLVLPGEVREPIKAALLDWVESLAPKVVVFPDPTFLEVQGLERLLAASSVDPLVGLFL